MVCHGVDSFESVVVGLSIFLQIRNKRTERVTELFFIPQTFFIGVLIRFLNCFLLLKEGLANQT